MSQSRMNLSGTEDNKTAEKFSTATKTIDTLSQLGTLRAHGGVS